MIDVIVERMIKPDPAFFFLLFFTLNTSAHAANNLNVSHLGMFLNH